MTFSAALVASSSVSSPGHPWGNLWIRRADYARRVIPVKSEPDSRSGNEIRAGWANDVKVVSLSFRTRELHDPTILRTPIGIDPLVQFVDDIA